MISDNILAEMPPQRSVRAIGVLYVLTKWNQSHDDVIKWKHFPPYWPFVRGIHRSPVNSPHKGQWRGTLMFSLICVWINDWVNNREAGFETLSSPLWRHSNGTIATRCCAQKSLAIMTHPSLIVCPMMNHVLRDSLSQETIPIHVARILACNQTADGATNQNKLLTCDRACACQTFLHTRTFRIMYAIWWILLILTPLWGILNIFIANGAPSGLKWERQ